MLGKNPFRWFLYFILTIAVLKLCYNLGYRMVSGRSRAASEARAGKARPNQGAQGLRGIILDPADSAAAAADTAAQSR